MNLTFRPLGLSELLPRYVFAESLLARRRVLEVGAVVSTGGESAAFLIKKGARSVLACDSNEHAIAEAQKRWNQANLHYRLDVFETLEPASFDVIAVADLTGWAKAPEKLQALMQLLAPHGYLLGGLRHPSGLALAHLLEPENKDVWLTCGQLLDALTPHFSSVQVASQTPALAYQFHFEQLDGLQVDRSLSVESEPAYFVVIAGSEPTHALGPRCVQLPPEPLSLSKNRIAEYSQRARDWQERAARLKKALEASRQLGLEQERELGRQKTEIEKSEEQVSRLTARLEMTSLTPKLEVERDELARRIRRHDAETEAVKAQLLELQTRNAGLEQRLDVTANQERQAKADALAATEALRLEKARKEQVVQQLDEARERLRQAYADLQKAQEEASAASLEVEKWKLTSERQRLSISDLEKDTATAKAQEIRLATMHSAALASLEELQAHVANHIRQVQGLQDTLVAKEADLAHATRQVDVELKRNSVLRTELTTLQEEAERLRHAFDAQTTLVLAMETELAAEKSQADLLRQKYQQMLVDEQKMRSLNVDLEEKVYRLETELTEKKFFEELLSEREKQFELARVGFEREKAQLSRRIEQLERANPASPTTSSGAKKTEASEAGDVEVTFEDSESYDSGRDTFASRVGNEPGREDR